MQTPAPVWFDDVDITDWEDLPPEDLLRERRAQSDRHAAARAFKYSRATASFSYDTIGFRWSAAVPAPGPVPLQTIHSMRLQRTDAERKSAEVVFVAHAAEQESLKHRPLDLPLTPPGMPFTWQRRGKLIDFIANQDAGAVRKGEVWTFPLSAPPAWMIANAAERDFPLLPTQYQEANVPGAQWVPFLELLEAGHFQRMQEWRERLISVTAPGCFYCFVSHRWLAVAEPDPEGRQAAVLAWQMFSHLCEAVRVARIRGLHTPRKYLSRVEVPIGPSGSSLAEALLVNVLRQAIDDDLVAQAWREALTVERLTRGYGVATANQDLGLAQLSSLIRGLSVLRSLCERIFLWYDYSCMPQVPRSAADEQLFRQALPHLPSAQLVGRTAILLDDAEDYLSRAWCTLEAVVADPHQTIDLLVGSKRNTSRGGFPELYFENLIEDRSHIQWRAVLDTELFRIQTPEHCMARLNLSATDPADIGFIYKSLSKLSAPSKIHFDAMELVTGVVPLPVTEHHRVLVPRARLGTRWKPKEPVQTLNWTGAVTLESAWGSGDDALSVTPFLHFHPDVPTKDHRPRFHIVVVAACEGEAILISNWVRVKRGELEELLGSDLHSLSWLATDIAPVGHFVQGTLQAMAIDCPHWVVVSFEARFINCNLTSLVLALLGQAKGRCHALVIDRPENNVIELESEVTDQPSEDDEAIDLSAAVFPTLPGGLFRSGLLEHLLAAPPARPNPDWSETSASG